MCNKGGKRGCKDPLPFLKPHCSSPPLLTIQCDTREVREKYLANRKYAFWAFMDLEKAHDTNDRQGMWQMQRAYEVGGKLLNAVEFLCW